MMSRHNRRRAVSASALAQMGVCERLVVFEHFNGKHPSPAQRAALQRGLRAHRRFAAGRALSEGGPEPQVLQPLQDLPRRTTPAGQPLSLTYCRPVQFLCRCTRRSTTLLAAVLAALVVLLWLAVAGLGTWGVVLVR